MDNKIVTARFATDNYVNVYDVYQWDYGQVLRIEGLKLPNMVEIHFSLQETSGEAKTRIGVTKDGVTDVVIPDSFLENSGIGDNYKIFAWVYIADKDSGSTEYKITIHIKARAKPEISHGGQDGEVFQEAVEAVRDAAKRAAESEKQAEGWAHGREDLPERAEDNAMYYAGKASEDAEKTATDRTEVERLTESSAQMQGEVAKDLEEVKNLSSQAQTSATNAALSEQKSEEAATRAETAQTGAETAEDNAELAAQKTGQDKTAVEQAKKLVQQMGQEVLDNKNAVDKTVQDFNLTAQQALADVNNAGQTQTERVQTVGNTAVENIKTAQNTARQAVETAKSEAIKAVQTEGTTQTGNVTAEGEKQVQAVQQAAQEIISDREQIQKNTTDIADLRQKKADAIVETASGTLLNVKDSAHAKIVNFKINKNVDWLKITGKNLLNVQGEKTGNNIDLMEFGTGRIKYTTQDNYGGGYVAYAQVFKAGTYMLSAKITKDGESEKGIRLGFNKEVKIKNNTLIYNNYYKHYFMQEYAKTIEITSGEEFTLMIALNSVTAVKGSVIEISEIQMEQGNTITNYEPYCEEQNVFPPITEDKLNTLHTNYPTTIISNSENAEMLLTYIADTKNYYLNREQVLQNQILDIQNALISQKISGGGIKVTNSAKLPIVKLSVFGKSEQVQTTGKNLFNVDNIIQKTMPDGKTYWGYSYVLAAGDYTISCLNPNNYDGKTDYLYCRKLLNGEYGDDGIIYVVANGFPQTKKITIEQGEELVFFNATPRNESDSKEKFVKYLFQLEKGASATTYEPYTGGKPSPSVEYPQEITAKEFKDIKIHGKNLLGGKYHYTYYSLGIGTIKENISNPEPIFPYTPAEENRGVGKIMYCKKGTTYTLSVTNANSNYAISIAEYASIEDAKNKDKCIGNTRVSSTDRISYTASSDGILLCYIAGKWTDGTTTIHTCTDTELLQVEIGETATDYDPYTEQTFSLSEPVVLSGLKVKENGNYTDENGQQWITDEIDLARGKYVQRIAKYIFDGTEHVNDKYYPTFVVEMRKDGLTGVRYDMNEMLLTQYGVVSFSNNDCRMFAFDATAWEVSRREELSELLTEKKNGENPVSVLYRLNIPIETDLPPEIIAAFKQLHTNYPTTLVSNNADAEMELTYTVDTQSYIDGKIAEVSKAIL